MDKTSQATAFAICGLLLGAQAIAATPQLQIAPRVGTGSLRVDRFAGTERFIADDDTSGLGASVAYLTSPGLVFEIGSDSFGSFNLFGAIDNFRLTQTFASVGYQAELGHGWRLVPRFGRAHWRLKAKEGFLFNPGPEQTRSISGGDYYWEVGLSRQISRVVALGLAYKQGDYDFGRARATTFNVTLGF
jgi:hypothetical protein